MSKLLCALAAIVVLQIPGVKLQGSGSGSGSGSGNFFGLPLFPLASVASLTQEQRSSIVTVGFRGMDEQQFIQSGVNAFRQEVTDITNEYFSGNRIAKRQQQQLYTPQDITVIDSPTVVDGVLMIEFIVGGQNGESPVSSSEMAALIEREGPRLAMALEEALRSVGIEARVEFAGVMEAQSAQALSQTAVIGIVIGAVVAIVLVAVLLVVIAIVSCIKTIRKRKAGKTASTEYVAVSEVEDGTTEFSSNWQPMKVNAKSGDYTAVPASTFQNVNSNNTAL